MKRVLLALLAVILILGALGAVGFAGYRFGYQQGAQAAEDGNVQIIPRDEKFFDPHGMPLRDFGRGFDRGFGPGRFIMNRGIGFGFFSPLMFLVRLAFWGLVIWAVYTLITRSGWRLTRTVQITETPARPTEAGVTEVKEE